MTLIRLAAAAEHALTPGPFIAAGIAFSVFLLLGIVAWSYRDVANRHSDKVGGGHDGHDSHSAGH